MSTGGWTAHFVPLFSPMTSPIPSAPELASTARRFFRTIHLAHDLDRLCACCRLTCDLTTCPAAPPYTLALRARTTCAAFEAFSQPGMGCARTPPVGDRVRERRSNERRRRTRHVVRGR
eukprot:scaffold3_cov108-Isochrysis_galbana.AAC.10